MPFSFMPLAGETSLSEFQSDSPDTIVENSDGTFSIADKSACKIETGLDLNFKKLVDSVLKH